MALGNGNFLGTLLGSQAGQSIAKGPIANYMRRPQSNTDLFRTTGSNMLARLQAARKPPTRTMTGLTTTGTVNGVATPQQYDFLGGYKPAGTPTYQTQRPKPDLQRFVPWGGERPSTAMYSEGPFGQNGGGVFGGSGGGGAAGGEGGVSQVGDYRTLLARLFPAFRGEGPIARGVDDYFGGPIQEDFWGQNQHLR